MVLGKYKELQMNAEKKYFNICVYLRSSASCPPQCIDTYLHVWREPYVWATSTGATVDVHAPSRGATLGAFICGLNPFHSIKRQLNSVITIICG
jgi:hypothetical protein